MRILSQVSRGKGGRRTEGNVEERIRTVRQINWIDYLHLLGDDL